MLVSLVSAKGAPGVTTTAMALAACATAQADASGDRRPLLVELDPSGGDIEMLTAVHGEPGLPHVFVALRSRLDDDKVRGRAVEAPLGVSALLSPAGGWAAEAAVSACSAQIGPALAGLDGLVIADAGRWSRSQRTAQRIFGSSVVMVVCHATPTSVQHARWLLEELRAALPAPAVVVVVGERPYRVAAVQAAFAVPVLGPVAWNPKGVNELCVGGSGSWRWRYSTLARSARGVLDELMASVREVGYGRVA